MSLQEEPIYAGLPVWAYVEVVNVCPTGTPVLQFTSFNDAARVFLPAGDPRVVRQDWATDYPPTNMNLTIRKLAPGESLERRLLLTSDVRLLAEGLLPIEFSFDYHVDHDFGDQQDATRISTISGVLHVVCHAPSHELKRRRLGELRDRIGGESHDASIAAKEVRAVLDADRLSAIEWLLAAPLEDSQSTGALGLGVVSATDFLHLLPTALSHQSERVVASALVSMAKRGVYLSDTDGDRLAAMYSPLISRSLAHYLEIIRHPSGLRWLETLVRSEDARVVDWAAPVLKQYKGE